MKYSAIGIHRILLLIILIAFLVISGCKLGLEQRKTPNVSEDTPLPEFIIGRWKYEGKYHYGDNGSVDIFWEYTFVDSNTINIWTGSDGGTCSYKFIEPEVILINCRPRLIEMMQWSIKRDGQFLMIQRLAIGESEVGDQLKFERTAVR